MIKYIWVNLIPIIDPYTIYIDNGYEVSYTRVLYTVPLTKNLTGEFLLIE